MNKLVRQDTNNSPLAVGDITLHLINVNFSKYFIFVVPSIHLQIHDMSCDGLNKSCMSIETPDRVEPAHSISCFVVFVPNDEDHIKATENRGLEVDILPWTLFVVVSSPHWISSREDGCSGIQNGSDPRLSNRDGLLLHCFVDRNSVLISHFVKLVDAYHSPVRDDHCPTLKVELALQFSGDISTGSFTTVTIAHRNRISLNDGRQTGGTASFPRCVNRDGGHFLHELQKLTFGRTRIAQQQNVDVSAETHPIWKDLLRPAE